MVSPESLRGVHGLLGRQAAERAVRPGAIVVLPPCFDELTRIAETEKPVAAETLVPQLADEALSVRVLHRFAGANGVQLHSSGIGSCAIDTK